MNYHRRGLILAAIVPVLALAFLSAPVAAEQLYFVDAHSQIDHRIDDMEIVTRRMTEHGVSTTILSARGQREDKEIINFAGQSGGRVIASIRTKGGKYAKNKPRYYEKLERQGSSGKFGAIAEVIMYHAQKGDKADEVRVLPSDARVQAALEVARANRWPFVAHIEFAALDRDDRKLFLREFEQLLGDNLQTPVLLIHMGQLNAAEAGPLLRAHPNLYLLTSHADPHTTDASSQPWTNMFRGGRFTPEWQALITRYADRFVFALDNVWPEHWQDTYGKKVAFWRTALKTLDPATAEKIAHRNAERLYSLK